MTHDAPSGPVFKIEDSDDDDDLNIRQLEGALPDASDTDIPFHASEQTQSLLNTTELAVGTAGCCGAVCLVFGCLCCGMCREEFVETYTRFTLCGRWWPLINHAM